MLYSVPLTKPVQGNFEIAGPLPGKRTPEKRLPTPMFFPATKLPPKASCMDQNVFFIYVNIEIPLPYSF